MSRKSAVIVGGIALVMVVLLCAVFHNDAIRCGRPILVDGVQDYVGHLETSRLEYWLIMPFFLGLIVGLVMLGVIAWKTNVFPGRDETGDLRRGVGVVLTIVVLAAPLCWCTQLVALSSPEEIVKQCGTVEMTGEATDRLQANGSRIRELHIEGLTIWCPQCELGPQEFSTLQCEGRVAAVSPTDPL